MAPFVELRSDYVRTENRKNTVSITVYSGSSGTALRKLNLNDLKRFAFGGFGPEPI
jgi:hypothetical protein